MFGRFSNRWAELDSDEKPFTEAEAAYFNDSATFAYESFRNKVPALSCLSRHAKICNACRRGYPARHFKSAIEQQ